MLRIIGCAVVALSLVAALGTDDGLAVQMKTQMVKGTIKSVDSGKDLLVVSQKVKNENVDRELSILKTTEFAITEGGTTKQYVGRDGLAVLEGHEGSAVAVKCDKDVNVLKVTVTLKK